jgi:hypothetical protein
MTKKLIILCLFLSSFSFISTPTHAKKEPLLQTKKEIYDPEMNCTKKMHLTLEQQKQLDQIYNKIRQDYSELISAYSQAGALPPSQVKLRHVMLNNYIKTFYKRNYRWCSEHESDEWEEEWYNNDND